MGGRLSAAWLGLAVLVAAGCRQALSTVLDLPPPRPPAQQPAVAAAAAQSAVPVAEDTVRPPIERLLHADSVRALLPRDHAGNIDWVAAVRSGIINPRPVLPGRPRPAPGSFQFAFDFVYPGPDTTFDAHFPHSVHTEWLSCQQCHPRIFAYRNAPISMGEIFQGRYCAECHGKVAYPVASGCERCHRRLSMPPDRAQPEFLGTLVLARVQDDSGNARGVRVNSLPRAQFPHWVHRIRYRCKACHMEVFEPRSGANEITMQAIRDGQKCGVCHNGTTAFAPTMASCDRCHVREAAPAAR